jgi:hypothetical protein
MNIKKNWLMIAALAGVGIWLWKNKMVSTPSLIATLPLTASDCMASSTLPWMSSPNKDAFLAFAKTKTTDPVWAKADACQWWEEFNKQQTS